MTRRAGAPAQHSDLLRCRACGWAKDIGKGPMCPDIVAHYTTCLKAQALGGECFDVIIAPIAADQSACRHEPKAPHACPFRSEIHDDDVTQCTCCDQCEYECGRDI